MFSSFIRVRLLLKLFIVPILIKIKPQLFRHILHYFLDYFKGEINAWDVTLSTEWETLCALKVLPNWKDLGKRLGERRMK